MGDPVSFATKLLPSPTMAGEGPSDQEARDHIFQSRLEFWKAMVDFYKHLMTLSVASIGAFGRLLGTVFQQSAAKQSERPLIYAIFFIVVLLLSLIGDDFMGNVFSTCVMSPLTMQRLWRSTLMH
jgi:hypothetical protein